jgi:hypothetical protein
VSLDCNGSSPHADIFSVFGDIALAIGGAFEEYLPFVVKPLQDAAATMVPNTPDMIEFLNKLREGIFEGYTGIIQGLRSDHKGASFQPYAEFLVAFCKHVAADPSHSAEVVRSMVGVLGYPSLSGSGRGRVADGVHSDVAATLGPAVRDMVKQQWVATLIGECAAIGGDDAEGAREVAQYAQQKITVL